MDSSGKEQQSLLAGYNQVYIESDFLHRLPSQIQL
jgi:hypothetical protein